MAKTHENRPEIDAITAAAALRRWYWTKDELLNECRRLGLKVSGGKFLLLDRIAHYHETGETVLPKDKKPKVTSKFDWHSAPLTPQTIITASYKNTQNVRRFFKAEAGPQFKFNIAFMDWMRANTGKTLADACAAYGTLKVAKGQTKIRDHNQFNQYTRDFLADNPDLGMDDVRRVWARKIKLPSDTGRHRYAREDLNLDD